MGLKGGEEGPVGAKGFCARREKWDQGRACWNTEHEAGNMTRIDSLPKMAQGKDFEWEPSCKIGDTVDAFGGKYVVCAIEKLA